MATKAEKEAVKAAKEAEKEAVKADVSADAPVEAAPVEKPTKADKDENGSFKVFYRELTQSGKRDGAVAHKVFTKRSDAEAFAEKVGGRVK